VKTAEELALKVKLVEAYSEARPLEELAASAERMRQLLDDFHKARDVEDDRAAEKAAREIVELEQSASALVNQLAQPQGSGKLAKAWPYIGMAVLALVLIGLAWFLARYTGGVGMAKLASIEGTRPVLVIAAIISTIAFGGALVLAALFSSQAAFEVRFRHAREIFLVFSGIFGTVIGFYFGAGETGQAGLGVDATLAGATLVTHATGGTPPYVISVTHGPNGETKTQKTGTAWASFAFDRKKDSLSPLLIAVSDSRNLQGARSLTLDPETLQAAGWASSGEAASAAPGAVADP